MSRFKGAFIIVLMILVAPSAFGADLTVAEMQENFDSIFSLIVGTFAIGYAAGIIIKMFKQASK
jgi:hypothetical protein